MTQDNTPDFDIRRYWAIILKRKYITLSVALAVLSIFTWGSFLLPETYEASSTVFIERSSLIAPLLQGVGVPGNMEERLRNLRDSITSKNIIDRVIKRLDPDTNPENSLQYASIRRNLSITVRSDRRNSVNLFTIWYEGGDPETVRDLVNTLVNEYIEENKISKRTDAYEVYAFIEGQLMDYKDKLEESDRSIRKFRERNPQMVPQSETTLLTRIEGFQTSRIEAEIRLKELIRKQNNIEKQLSGEKELTVAFITREGSPQARLSTLNSQLMLLMTKFTENHPDIIKVKIEIEETKKQIARGKDSPIEYSGTETTALNPIYQQLKEELANTDTEIESLRARSKELLRQQQVAQKILGRMPKEQEEWTRLQRDRNVYQSIYDDLLGKLQNAGVSKDLELANKTGTFRVVDPAVLPGLPIKPDRVKIILLGVFLGIASGIGVAYGLDYLEHSFKDEASIEDRFKLPVLAAIPEIVTETDELSAKRLDRKVFAAAGVYLFVIGLVLAKEFLYRYMGIEIINF